MGWGYRVVEGGDGLVEDDGVVGDGHPALRGVLRIVEADAHDRLRVDGGQHLGHGALLLPQRQVAEEVLLGEELALGGEAAGLVGGGGLADALVAVGVDEAAQDGGAHRGGG